MQRTILGAAAAVLLAGLLPATQARAAAPRRRNPASPCASSTCRSPLSQICTLKPGQTPNVDKLMPTVNWTTAADFGFEDHFVVAGPRQRQHPRRPAATPSGSPATTAPGC